MGARTSGASFTSQGGRGWVVARRGQPRGCRRCGNNNCVGCYCGNLRGTECSPSASHESAEPEEVGPRQNGQPYVPAMASGNDPISLTKALNALGVSAESKAGEVHEYAEDGVSGPSRNDMPKHKKKYRGGEAKPRGRRLASSAVDEVLGAATRHVPGDTRGSRLSPWQTICLISEFAALMAGVLAVGYHGRRSRSRVTARDSRPKARRGEERRTMYATDSAGQRKWQKHIEAQARKKGIAIALLLGWIRSPFGDEEDIAKFEKTKQEEIAKQKDESKNSEKQEQSTNNNESTSSAEEESGNGQIWALIITVTAFVLLLVMLVFLSSGD